MATSQLRTFFIRAFLMTSRYKLGKSTFQSHSSNYFCEVKKEKVENTVVEAYIKAKTIKLLTLCSIRHH